MTKTTNLKEFRKFSFLVVAITSIVAQSCNSDTKQNEEDAMASNGNVIEILTEAMDFQMQDTIPAGWNTWRYMNNSTQTHFILIDDYPDGITIDSVKEKVFPVFGEGMTLIIEGKPEEGAAVFSKLPGWFSQVKWPGGVGLTSPGQTSETTLKLDSGHYIIECYVKMNTGMFHTNMGMIKELVVMGNSGMKEPEANIPVTISTKSGIELQPPTEAGTYTFSVEYLDQTVYEHFLGHDINLVKMDENANHKVLEDWLDWRDPAGLIEPAPGGFTFLGGINDMPAGSKAYFTAYLEPGEYALVSEVPDASEKNLLKTFVVTDK